MNRDHADVYRHCGSTRCNIERLLCLLISLPAPFFLFGVADPTEAQCGSSGNPAPQSPLRGNAPPHSYLFQDLCPAAGPVHVILKVTADLGCHASDATDCNTQQPCPGDPDCWCGVAPTAKYVTLRIGPPGGEVSIHSGNTDPDPAVQPWAQPSRAWNDVPDDGRFFKDWAINNGREKEYGMSWCSGMMLYGDSTNEHRFYIPAGTWNTWLGVEMSIRFIVTITSSSQELSTYCGNASGSGCNTTSIGSSSQIAFSYTPIVGSCCDPATGQCTVTSQTGCSSWCGLWTEDGTCLPNPCGVAPLGGCCYGSGLCVVDTGVHCACVGGTYSGDGVSYEPNSCTEPPVIYVDVNASGTTHNGTSWTNAYLDLQAAQKVTAGSRLTASST